MPSFNVDSMSLLDWYNLLASVEADFDQPTQEELGRLSKNYWALMRGESAYDEMGQEVTLVEAKAALETFLNKMEAAGGYCALL